MATAAPQYFQPDPLPPALTNWQQKPLQRPLRDAERSLERLQEAGQTSPFRDWLSRVITIADSEMGTKAALFERFSGATDFVAVDETPGFKHPNNDLPGDNSELRQMLENTTEFRTSNLPGTLVPEASQLPALVSQLVSFAAEDSSIPPLLRVAMIQAQLELIQPYEYDGDRYITIVAAAALREFGVLRQFPLLLRREFSRYGQEQARAIDAIRNQRDWIPWLELFSRVVESAAERTRELVRGLSETFERDRRRVATSPTATVSMIQLFDLLPFTPVVSMPYVTRALNTTKPTASKAISSLVDLGVLREIGDRKRGRTYQYLTFFEQLNRIPVASK